MKICKSCGELKHYNLFYMMGNSYSAKCKVCTAKARIEASNPDWFDMMKYFKPGSLAHKVR